MSKLVMNHRLLGVVFIGLLVLSVWLVSAIFGQKFTDFDRVGLTTSNAGLNLPDRADVKIRGVIVGQVMNAESEGDGAVLELGIKPEEIGQIPQDVSAVILPKTLFGEKYVSLTVPEQPSSRPLQAGDSIEQTQLPVEVEKVLNDLYPLLRAVQPAELNYTLNALAEALEGRGEKLGEGFVTLDGYLKRMNPELPALLDDLRLLAQVTDTYADVFPQLADTLRNTTKTGNTLVSKEQKLNAFLVDLTSFSDTTTGFLNDNGNNLIRLSRLSEPIVALLRRYSPTFPCMLEGIVNQAPRLASTFRGFVFHIDLKLLPEQPRGYTQADTPVYGASNAPDCAGLPNPPVPYPRFPNLDDGVDGIGKGGQRTSPGFGTTAGRDVPQVAQPARSRMSVGPSGTASQKALVNSLLAPSLGTSVDEMSDVSALLFAPALAGTEVSVR